MFFEEAPTQSSWAVMVLDKQREMISTLYLGLFPHQK